jgi:hypothetical protein
LLSFISPKFSHANIVEQSLGKESVFSPAIGLQEYRNSWESTLIIQKSVSDYARWIEMARDEAPQCITAGICIGLGGVLYWLGKIDEKFNFHKRGIFE